MNVKLTQIGNMIMAVTMYWVLEWVKHLPNLSVYQLFSFNIGLLLLIIIITWLLFSLSAQIVSIKWCYTRMKFYIVVLTNIFHFPYVKLIGVVKKKKGHLEPTSLWRNTFSIYLHSFFFFNGKVKSHNQNVNWDELK